MEKIAQGAEAVLVKKDGVVVKHRVEKKYRNPELDTKIRKTRTRREAKILRKLEAIGFPAPRVLSVDEKTGKIEMSFVSGALVKNVLEKDETIIPAMGKNIATLHSHNIIHGDLTTSNMIVSDGMVWFLDFGLGFVSTKIEDRAVDLHLLGRALESTHHTLYPGVFKKILAVYVEHYDSGKDVVKRLEVVEKRGRYKGKRT
jgi:TP53 regulating kinase and related kinases